MTIARLEVGASVNAGYRILGNYNNAHVLAHNMNALSPEPFVVWTLDTNGAPHSGSYFTLLEAAEQEFALRCFSWLMPAGEAQRNPEELIRFVEAFPTHRVGFYKEWMLVQTYDEMDGGVLCYRPSDEWEGCSFPDLDYLKDYHTPEWQVGHLQEAIDFIDSYHQQD